MGTKWKLHNQLSKANEKLYDSEEHRENLDYLLYQLEEFVEFQPQYTEPKNNSVTFSNMFVHLSVAWDENFIITNITGRNNLNGERIIWTNAPGNIIPSLFELLD